MLLERVSVVESLKLPFIQPPIKVYLGLQILIAKISIDKVLSTAASFGTSTDPLHGRSLTANEVSLLSEKPTIGAKTWGDSFLPPSKLDMRVGIS